MSPPTPHRANAPFARVLPLRRPGADHLRLDAGALAQMRPGRSPESAVVTRRYDVPPELLAALRRIPDGDGADSRNPHQPCGAAGENAPERRGPPNLGAADLALPAIGSIVARKYAVVSHLGCGGSAAVSLAVFRSAAGVHKLVVLKYPRRAPAGRGPALDDFIEEARLAARMNHQHVIHVYDVAEHEGLPVIVMEHLDGRSLASVMTSARGVPALDRSLKLDIVAKVLAGLHYTHDLCDLAGRPLHVVHRDVSPHNIVLTCDGQVKLIDFGIAQCAARVRPPAPSRFAGKLGYMAPEQLHGAADRRADIFAAGIVLWELMTSRRFWAHATQAEVMRRLLNFDIPRRASLEAELDGAVASVCRRALAPRPDDRYATARQMQADIERALRERPTRAPNGALGQIVREIHADERLARQCNLKHALSELDAVESSARAATRGCAGRAPRGRSHRSAVRRASGILAALLALQSGDAASTHRPNAATSPVWVALAQPLRAEAPRRYTTAHDDDASAGSASERPRGDAEAAGTLPAPERDDGKQPAAPSRPPPTRRRARARVARAAPAQEHLDAVGRREARVTDLEPGIDLRLLRPAGEALGAARGSAR